GEAGRARARQAAREEGVMSVEITPRHPAERDAAKRSPLEQREHERHEVAQHYEHNADIFKMVLDKRLAYATGVFLTPDDTLDVAQERKFARLKTQLDV